MLMNVEVVRDYEMLSQVAAKFIQNAVKNKKNTVLGLPTGSTPEGMYAELVKMYRNHAIDFSKVITFNLDEYVGLSPDHPQSYNYYMRKHLFDHINMKAENINIPAAFRTGIDNICREYEQKITSTGGIDLQVLGIGGNGHIGFNEPAENLSLETNLVELSEETIEANSRFFNSKDEVPSRAVTMGVGTIMQARKIILLASGTGKANSIKKCFSGKVSTAAPASLLQLHRDFTLLLDEEAASNI